MGKPLRLCLLTSDPDGWHTKDLCRAAKELSLDLVIAGFAALRGRVGGCDLMDRERGDLDALLVRSMGGASLEQVIFRMDLLLEYERAGVPIVNPPRAIEACVDKFLALRRAEAAGLSIPRTRVSQSQSDALRDFDDLGGDVVLKPLFGSCGRGMVRLSEREIAARAYASLEDLSLVIHQQEFIAHPDGDLRVLVIGGEAILSMRRKPARDAAARGEWRANVARGGEAIPHSLSREEAELAVRAATSVGALVAGVDLIPARDGRLLLAEVNSAPGWRALARVSGVDVAKRVVEFVTQKARR